MSKPFQMKWQKLFAEATSYHQAGNLQLALQNYRKILRQAPGHADALHLSGIILAEQGKTQEGLIHLNRAIAVNSSYPPFYVNRGLIYKRLSQFNNALPDFNKALALGYKTTQLYNHIGECLLAKKEFSDAIFVHQKAIELDPNDINAYHNLGNVYWEKKDYLQAERYYQKVLALKADSPETLANLGLVFGAQEKISEAICLHKHAIAIKPDFIQAYLNLGVTYNLAYQYSQAEEIYQKALAKWPDDADLYLNLGTNYRSQNQIEMAIGCFRKSLDIKPSPEAEFSMALSLLLLGDFKNGWAYYESRLHTKDRERDLNYPQPQWQGEDLTGKFLLIHVEQGLGDTIQFFRYLKLFPDTSNIYLACQKELIPLLQPYFANILPRRIPEQHFDYQLPIMSLPLRFNTDSIDKIPFSEGYLRSPPNHRLDGFIKNDRLKVGLVWAGNQINPNDRNRTIPLAMFRGLLELENIQFYSLQWGEGVKEIESYKKKLLDTSSEVKNLADTAALVSQLDLIITVDTAIAHLSGAMAKPTWILLQFSPDFRWLLERADSPWYKSVRLFRQKKAGDWHEVLQEVKRELVKVIGHA